MFIKLGSYECKWCIRDRICVCTGHDPGAQALELKIKNKKIYIFTATK